MTFLIESGRNAPQMEVKLSQMGPGFGDHQASFHSLCHSPTMNHALSGAPPRMKLSLPYPSFQGKVMEGSDCQLTRSALVCLEEWKQSEANSLIALKGRAGPPSRMLPGHGLERCDGLLFQPWLPAAWGSLLCGLLSCSAGRLCQCRERTELVRRALLLPSAHHKRSTGAWDNNGKHLDREREKAGSRTDQG